MGCQKLIYKSELSIYSSKHLYEKINIYKGVYRWGFNGEMLENEISGDGMAYDLGARFYDSRLGRMFSTDPLEYKYPWQSSYSYCDNSPIALIDYKGMGDGGGDPTGDVKTKPKPDTKQKTTPKTNGKPEVSKKTKVNSNGKIVEKTIEVIQFLRKLTSVWALVLTPTEMGTNDIPPKAQLSKEEQTEYENILSKKAQGTELTAYEKEKLNELNDKLFGNPKTSPDDSKTGGKFLDKTELAKRLGTTVKDYHDNIKPLMKKDFSQEMKKIGTTNPDFSPNDKGNVMLKNPSTGKTIHTNVPFDAYKKK